MGMYEVDKRLEALEFAAEDGMYLDQDTGELLSYEEAFRRVWGQMVREEQIANLINNIKNLKIEIDARKEQMKRLKEQSDKKERSLAWSNDQLMELLTNADGTTEKIRTPLNTVYVRSNKPSVVIDDEEKLPDEFKIKQIVISPDKGSLNEVLSRGIEVPGAHLERSRSVIIK